MINCLRAAQTDGILTFSRQHRLLRPGDFTKVFSARKILCGRLFALHYRDNELPGARLGLVIPKKQAHSAVLRNAIKRQAREVFRLRLSRLAPSDVVLRLIRLVNVPEKSAWRAEIDHLFEQLEHAGI